MYKNNIFKRDILVLENKNQGKGFLNKRSETLTTAGFLFILFFLIRCTAYEKELNDNYSISAFDSVDEIALAYTDENNIFIEIAFPAEFLTCVNFRDIKRLPRLDAYQSYFLRKMWTLEWYNEIIMLIKNEFSWEFIEYSYNNTTPNQP